MEFTQILEPLSSIFPPSKLLKKSAIPFRVLIVSPHPDDECITSSLALRLKYENNALVMNVAVTLGSKIERQKARAVELRKACRYLNFKNEILDENWPTKEKELRKIILKFKPNLIIAPHQMDHHPTHIKTSKLLKKVLQSTRLPSTLIAWSEFWAPISRPNLMLEVPKDIVHLQMIALTKHAGEISRNPYHLRLPAWMMDNIRRGSELISGLGSESPKVPFGVLYQLQILQDKKFSKAALTFPFLSSHADIGQIFKLILEEASGSRTRVK